MTAWNYALLLLEVKQLILSVLHRIFSPITPLLPLLGLQQLNDIERNSK